MKNLMIVLVLALINGVFLSSAIGQSRSKTEMNYAVLTSKIAQFKPIGFSSEALAREDGDKFGQFKAVLYGPEVVQLTDKRKMKPLLRMARRSNLTLAVCEMALKKMKVNPDDIPKEFEVVDNAFLHALQLQKGGHFILSL